MERLRPFDWNSETDGFGDIMKAGGFDAVIGNPPYVRQETLSSFKEYFRKHYESFHGVADLYVYFVEKGVSLLRDSGYYSIIVSSSFLRTNFAEPLRAFLKRVTAILRIVDFGGLAVFENAKDTYVCVPLLSKQPQPEHTQIAKVTSLDFEDLDAYVSPRVYTIPHQNLSPEVWSIRADSEISVFQKIVKAGEPLGDFVERRFFRGVTTGLNHAFIIDGETRKALIKKDKSSAHLIKPLLHGKDIRRWMFARKDQWIIFTRRGVNINNYPAIREYLSKWEKELTPKKSSSSKTGRKPGRYKWYEIQDDVAYYQVFESPKIIYPDIAKGPRFCLDTGGSYLANTAYCLGTADRYLVGILNSRLFWFAISHISIPFGTRGGKYRYRLIYQYMEKVPIRRINFSRPRDKARHDKMVTLVERMLELNKKKHSSKLSQPELKRVENKIASIDAEIDKLVYDIYGLTKDEIAVVEISFEGESDEKG